MERFRRHVDPQSSVLTCRKSFQQRDYQKIDSLFRNKYSLLSHQHILLPSEIRKNQLVYPNFTALASSQFQFFEAEVQRLVQQLRSAFIYLYSNSHIMKKLGGEDIAVFEGQQLQFKLIVFDNLLQFKDQKDQEEDVIKKSIDCFNLFLQTRFNRKCQISPWLQYQSRTQSRNKIKELKTTGESQFLIFNILQQFKRTRTLNYSDRLTAHQIRLLFLHQFYNNSRILRFRNQDLISYKEKRIASLFKRKFINALSQYTEQYLPSSDPQMIRHLIQISPQFIYCNPLKCTILQLSHGNKLIVQSYFLLKQARDMRGVFILLLIMSLINGLDRGRIERDWNSFIKRQWKDEQLQRKISEYQNLIA